ncbi:MAG: cytochrome c biogenesis protein CcsA [Pseudomonadota bacterium]
MKLLIPILTILLYLAAAALAALRLFKPEISARLPRSIIIQIGFGALLLHALILYQTIVADDGLNLAFFQALSLGGWMIALVIMLSALTKPAENLAIFLFPPVALAVAACCIFATDSTRLLDASSGWPLGVHVITSLLAWSLFAIASVQAILLWIQDRHLHNRQPGGFIRALPPLQTMESLLFELIVAGMILLTISLASGFLYLHDMFAQHLVHKTILSSVAWILFAILIWGRYHYGWRGQIALRWTLIGFFVLGLAYFGSKAVLELIIQH